MRVSFRATHGAFALIVFLAAGLMLSASRDESAIMDELAHIPAGYGYVRHLDYRLNPEHPPLVKALAALPLLFIDARFPEESAAWQKDVNGQWAMGSEFLYSSGNNADLIIRLSRAGPILLTLILLFLVYWWSRELLGGRWALLPTLLFALSPHTLAHGHYVTTDIAAALGVVAATYFFLKFLLAPSRKRLVLAGTIFGLAQLTKFSTALLIPYLTFLICVFYFASCARDWHITDPAFRFRRFALRAFRFARSLGILFAVGYILVVYPAYALFTAHYPMEKQTADTEFILTSFAGGAPPDQTPCTFLRCIAELDIWMTRHAPTRPLAQYLLGLLMVLQRSAGGNTGYFLGEVSAAGWHHYFPLVYLMKEALPVIIMVFLAAFLAARNIVKRGLGRWSRSRIKDRLLDYLNLNFAEFSMLVFVIFYWAWSVASPLNIGFRHLFPVIPFIYILTAAALKSWVTRIEFPKFPSLIRTLGAAFRALGASSLKYLFLSGLVAWFLVETALAAPYFLSYFNQLGGGVSHGYRFVTDSNYDWGQDLLRLKAFVDERNNDNDHNNDIPKIAVDYFGGGDPKYYLGDCAVSSDKSRGSCAINWWSSRENPISEDIRYLAISVNTIQGATQRTAPGHNRKPEDEYRWLTELRPPKPGLGNIPEPDYRAGTSIFIYKL